MTTVIRKLEDAIINDNDEYVYDGDFKFDSDDDLVFHLDKHLIITGSLIVPNDCRITSEITVKGIIMIGGNISGEGIIHTDHIWINMNNWNHESEESISAQ